LEGFAYRTTLGLEIFTLTLFISLAVTLIAISFQALQAVRMNPTQALRSE
jgi:putative ABC transport system permease protein